MTSLLERLGGTPAIEAAVDLFYRRVLDDPLLAPVFEGISLLRLKGHQRRFLAQAFGGPPVYHGRDLAGAHAGLVARHGLGDRHFDAVLGHLEQSLAALGVAPSLRAEVLAIAEGTRGAVLGRAVAVAS